MPSRPSRLLRSLPFAWVLWAAGPAHALDCEKAMSTPELNECAARQQKAVELRLNQTYQKALKSLQQPDTEMDKFSATRQKLIEAQRAWVKFREADCEAVYLQYMSGGIRNLMFTGCMQKHAERRIEDLTAVFAEQ